MCPRCGEEVRFAGVEKSQKITWPDCLMLGSPERAKISHLDWESPDPKGRVWPWSSHQVKAAWTLATT
ncbi:rCG24048 [Rattus norvegicus]|uniref:RCG24048 n=1 Tax=Rattus norvegicus TaxID=10116 RepID=A6JST3_RAT|nr:rCG24048 [Rattus norvegicus]